jgi:hypothetical protein
METEYAKVQVQDCNNRAQLLLFLDAFEYLYLLEIFSFTLLLFKLLMSDNYIFLSQAHFLTAYLLC